jgi:hypothetical protein
LTRLWIVIVIAFLCVAPAARADPPRIDPRAAQEAQQLLPLIAGVGNFRVIEASSQGFQLGLIDSSPHPVGMLHLVRGPSQHVPRFRSRTYSMEISNFSPDLRVTERLVRAAWLIADHDGGASENTRVRQPIWDLDLQRNVTLALVVLALLLGALRRGKVSWELRLPHLLPALIQVAIFAYWSLYWPAVRDHIPSMALQLVMAVAADAVFSFARLGSWRIGASPLPVVLSMNLFVWFDPHGVVISILVAFATKALLHRAGRHVLNPSAIGLAAAGLVSYLAPGFIHVGGLFHMMNLSPNMAELMVLLAILPQTRFRILPISIAAVVALRLADNPAVLRPPMILAVALLATDPSTIPKTDAGKVLFGLLLGFGVVVSSWVFRRVGLTDDFAKVVPIPLANALVPQLDQLGNAIVSMVRTVLERVVRMKTAREASLLQQPIPNVVFVVLWLLITVTPLHDEKPHSFEPSLHWNLGTPLVMRDADDVPRCARNPVFCRPFTFAQELSLWRHPRPAARRTAPPQ